MAVPGRRLLIVGVLAALTSLALAGELASPTLPVVAAPAPTAAEHLATTPLPPRDSLDLARRLRGAGPGDSAPPPAAPEEIGAGRQFSVMDVRAAEPFTVSTTLRYASPHADWYVQDEFADLVDEDGLARSVDAFEKVTFPSILGWFGSALTPEPRVTFLLGRVPGVSAYFSGVDTLPRWANARSNERDLIYVNLHAIRPGQRAFDATLAHELEHLVQFGRCPNQEVWVDEGNAELASSLVGFGGPPVSDFLARPDVQLNAWSNDPTRLGRHYQAAYLFARYVAERAGGTSALPRLNQGCNKGEGYYDAAAVNEGLATGFDGLFADWLVANVVNDASIANGRFALGDLTQPAPMTATVTADTPLERKLPQYSANYIALPRGGGDVLFEADATVPLVAAPDAEGNGFWWSNRADNLDATLTRRVDLTGLSSATATFSVWYDVEAGYDFVYLAVLPDGASTWQVVPGSHGVADSGVGNDYGLGWSGTSGGSGEPAWVQEFADLTPFAGGPVQLRFEYVTDQGYSARGLALDNFRVPGVAEALAGEWDPAWEPNGWLYVAGPIPQPWTLRLVRWTAGTVLVEHVPVDEAGRAVVNLDPLAERSVLVVAPTAPRTLTPAMYRLSAAQAR